MGDEATTNSFLSPNLIQRRRRNHADENVSLDMPKNLHLYQHTNGLYWLETHQVVAPEYEGLRFEMCESVQTYPFSGHWGLSRTQKKAMQLYLWLQKSKTGVRNVTLGDESMLSEQSQRDAQTLGQSGEKVECFDGPHH